MLAMIFLISLILAYYILLFLLSFSFKNLFSSLSFSFSENNCILISVKVFIFSLRFESAASLKTNDDLGVRSLIYALSWFWLFLFVFMAVFMFIVFYPFSSPNEFLSRHVKSLLKLPTTLLQLVSKFRYSLCFNVLVS